MSIKIRSRATAALIAVVMAMTVFAVLPAAGQADVYGATKGTVKNGPVNVRSNAGSKYKKLGKLPNGKVITIRGSKKDRSGQKWYRITYKSRTGYVASKYIKLKSSPGPLKKYSPVKKGVMKKGPVNIRSNAGTGYKKTGTVKKNASVSILGQRTAANNVKWYKIKYRSKTGYVPARYVTVRKPAAVTTAPTAPEPTKPAEPSTVPGSGLNDEEFEAWMTEQGFLKSYKSRLRALHKAHPKWIFKAQRTGLNWSAMLEKEKEIGINLVEPTSPASWKSKEEGAYNSETGEYNQFDGRWNAASESIIAYYMDPRNFLNETSIYQFMDHSFDPASQNRNTIKSMVSRSSCFMNTADYINCLYNAGKNSKVNPNVITAMVIMEQGWRGGSGLISGTYKGYEGYYNHFNIGAYTTDTMNAIQRGLWWAKGAGTGATTYGRPWNTIEKSLSGGADYYSRGYLANNQYTYYTKKFNVMNGPDKVAKHQYMTNTSGAESEGRILKYAYEAGDDYPIVFHIPVYSGMPSTVCAKPQ